LFKTGFADLFLLSSFLFFQEGREKGERITSCRTFSDPIDFHREKDSKVFSQKKRNNRLYLGILYFMKMPWHQ